jgi:hydrogenase maturation protease
VTLLVLGIGHPDRGDDAAGWLVAERLAGVDGIVTRRVTADPAALLTDPLWDSADTVVVVDAVVTGAPAGSVHRWTASSLPAAPASGGTHDLGVATTLALAEALDRLPRRLEIVGIEVADVTLGGGTVAAVRRAAGAVADELAARTTGEGDRVPR